MVKRTLHFFMTRVSGCDGRYLSLAHQRRAWEELDAIFGGKTPVPPGPDPPPCANYSLAVIPEVPMPDLVKDPRISSRIRYIQITDISRPFFYLSGAPEFVMLFTYITSECKGWDLRMGVLDAKSLDSYAGEVSEQGGSGSINFMMVEIFSCDGAGSYSYASNWTSVDGWRQDLVYSEFSYIPDVELPAVSFRGFQAVATNGNSYAMTLYYCGVVPESP